IPERLDEIEVAGALVGSPINVVKAKTVDLLVPAEAEIVIEGFIDTEYLEPEAPFGESHGHVNLQEFNAFMDVTCITRRRDAILHRAAGKYVIAVNEDIDPENADAILWAMSYRANPSLDFHIMPHRDQGHGPRSKRNGGQDASVLIDATLKENFPPISLPKRE